MSQQPLGPIARAARFVTLVLLAVAFLMFVVKCDEENYRPWPQPSSATNP